MSTTPEQVAALRAVAERRILQAREEYALEAAGLIYVVPDDPYPRLTPEGAAVLAAAS